MRYFLLLVSLFFIARTIFAQSLNESQQQQALQNTQSLLRDPSQRQKAIDADPNAKDVDNKVNALAGSNNGAKEGMYEISAELMDKIVSSTGGDPVKMQTLVEEAQKDPQGFANKYMNDGQKAKIHDMANQIGGPVSTSPK